MFLTLGLNLFLYLFILMKTRKYIKRKKNRKYKTKKGGRTKKNILNRLTKVKKIMNNSKRNYNSKK